MRIKKMKDAQKRMDIRYALCVTRNASQAGVNGSFISVLSQSTSRAQASEMAMDEDDMGDANGQGEVDMAPEFHFDPENFTDLPLGKEEEMEILKGITGEWSQLAKTLNPEGFQLTANVARTVADRADEAEWNEVCDFGGWHCGFWLIVV